MTGRGAMNAAATLISSKRSFADCVSIADAVAARVIDVAAVVQDFWLASRVNEEIPFLDSIDEVIRSSSPVFYFIGGYDYSIDFEMATDDRAADFSYRQLLAVQQYLESRLDEAEQTVDKPSLQRLWSNKLHQIRFFSSSAYCHPIPTSVSRHFTSVGQHTVVKHISEARHFGNSEIVLAHRIGESQQGAFAQSSYPFTSQSYIEAEFEYRTFFFGNDELTIEFNRRLMNDGAVDIHSIQDMGRSARRYELDRDARRNLQRLRQTIPLLVFAIDYFLHESEIVPLELNPNFSWGWLGSPLSDAVVACAGAFIGNRAEGQRK